MTFRSFGAEEINLVGDSGTPAIEGSGNIAIKLGESTSTATTKLNIGDSSIATGELANPSNTTVLNCGIVTANAFYGTFKKGTGNTPNSSDGFVIKENEYIDWQAADGTSRVRITGEDDSDFILQNKSDNTQRIRISSDGSTRLRSESNLNLDDDLIGDGSKYVAHLQNPKNDIGDTVGLAFACSSSETTIGASIYLEREDTHSRGYLAFATKNTTYTTGVKERMRITKEGHVGIGEKNPTASTINSDLQSNSRVLAVGIVTCKEIYGSIAGDTSLTGDVTIDGDLNVTGDIAAYYVIPSDERLKDNIKPIIDPLAKVMSISGNTFNWNEKSNHDGQYDVGVIAQEIESLGLPEIVSNSTEYKSVRYSKLIPLLIEAIKELKVEVDNLKNQN